MNLRIACLLLSAALVADTLAEETPTTAPVAFPCTPSGELTPLCGFERPPEDLEVLAGEQALLVSEYGALSGKLVGMLSVFDLSTGTRRVLLPQANTAATAATWGDPSCPGHPGAELSPHGIHLAVAAGTQQLLVVNHRGRESIEFFELTGKTPAEYALSWRGCVVAPADAWFNDVINLPDGGLAATHMVKRGSAEESLLAAERSHEATGWVYSWNPTQGWQQVPGSAGGLPNGLEVSGDGATLYINYYLGDRVVAMDRATGTRHWEAKIDAPDNSSFAGDGALLVASHRGGLEEIFACAAHSALPCGLPFEIVRLDVNTGAASTVLASQGPPMGAATVAVEAQGTLYLGSFVGERLLKYSTRSVAQ